MSSSDFDFDTSDDSFIGFESDDLPLADLLSDSSSSSDDDEVDETVREWNNRFTAPTVCNILQILEIFEISIFSSKI